MTINKLQESGKVTLVLDGRLDTSTAQQLQDALAEAFEDALAVELDFAGVAYVSSSGLRVLLMGQKVATGKGATMSVSNVSDEIMEVLDMTGFSDILTINA